MIVGSGHDHTLDWWALGILVYEMIIGIPPFYNKNKHQMYYFIQHAPIRWPDREKHGLSVSEEAKDLISRVYFTIINALSSWRKTESRGLEHRTTWTRYWRILSFAMWTRRRCWRSRWSRRSSRR